VLVTHPPYPTGTLSSAGSAGLYLLLAQLSPLIFCWLSYCLSGSAHSYRLSGLTIAIASRAQLSPLGLSYRLSGSAIASRAQLSPLGRCYRLSGAATAIASRAHVAPRPLRASRVMLSASPAHQLAPPGLIS
jgi:hypothetical protein